MIHRSELTEIVGRRKKGLISALYSGKVLQVMSGPFD